MAEFCMGILVTCILIQTLHLIFKIKDLRTDTKTLDLLDRSMDATKECFHSMMDVMMDNVERIEAIEEKLGISYDTNCEECPHKDDCDMKDTSDIDVKDVPQEVKDAIKEETGLDLDKLDAISETIETPNGKVHIAKFSKEDKEKEEKPAKKTRKTKKNEVEE